MAAGIVHSSVISVKQLLLVNVSYAAGTKICGRGNDNYVTMRIPTWEQEFL